MKRWLGLILGILVISLFISPGVFAAELGVFEVKVSIAASLGVSLTPEDATINFGIMGVGQTSSTKGPITVTNNGSGIDQTYYLSVDDAPSGWEAVTTEPGFNKFRLCAAFNSDENVSWDPANHALKAIAVKSSATQFAGNQTGAAVPYDKTRTLYVRLETPSKTNSSPDDVKTMPVTVTATLVE